MKTLQFLVRSFLLLFKPTIQKLARLYDLQVIEAYQAQGYGKIIFSESLDIIQHRIPKSTYFNTASGDIKIEHGVVFGEKVLLLTGKHLSIEESEKNGQAFSAVPLSGRDIVIHDHAYIGSGAIIIGPCEIGSYAVVGAGAVVTKNVPARSLVVGNPAEIKKMF